MMMKGGSSTIVFMLVLVCIGMWMTNALVTEETKSQLPPSKSLDGSRYGRLYPYYSQPYPYYPPYNPYYPPYNPYYPPSPPASQKLPPSPPASQKLPPVTPKPPLTTPSPPPTPKPTPMTPSPPAIPKPTPTTPKLTPTLLPLAISKLTPTTLSSPAEQKPPPASQNPPSTGYFDPRECGELVGDAVGCIETYWVGDFDKEHCCSIFQQVSQCPGGSSLIWGIYPQQC